MALSFALAGVRGALFHVSPSPEARIFGLSFLFALTFSVVLALLYRRNWVRWLVVVCTLLGLSALPWSTAGLANGLHLGIHLTQAFLQGAAALLLISPSATSWFTHAADA